MPIYLPLSVTPGPAHPVIIDPSQPPRGPCIGLCFHALSASPSSIAAVISGGGGGGSWNPTSSDCGARPQPRSNNSLQATTLTAQLTSGLFMDWTGTSRAWAVCCLACCGDNRMPDPAIYSTRFFTVDGGLLSYGSEILELYRGAASYVDRICQGRESLQICRFRSRPHSNWSSILKPQKSSA